MSVRVGLKVGQIRLKMKLMMRILIFLMINLVGVSIWRLKMG